MDEAAHVRGIFRETNMSLHRGDTKVMNVRLKEVRDTAEYFLRGLVCR
jgi:hypothetical protein